MPWHVVNYDIINCDLKTEFLNNIVDPKSATKERKVTVTLDVEVMP